MKNNNDFIKAVDQIINSCNQVLEDANNGNSKAAQSFTYACDQYRKDISDKVKLVQKKHEELETELFTLQECEKSMKDTYATVVTSGDENGIKHLESELKAITGDIAFCKSKVDLLNGHIEKGDKKLFDNAYDAYKLQNEDISENRKVINEYFKLISDAINKLTAVKKDFDHINVVDNSHNMVKIYESFNGIIDVTGHRAGSDMEAKIRFIKDKSFV